MLNINSKLRTTRPIDTITSPSPEFHLPPLLLTTPTNPECLKIKNKQVLQSKTNINNKNTNLLQLNINQQFLNGSNTKKKLL